MAQMTLASRVPVLLLGAALACSSRTGPPAGLGHRIAQGPARNLLASPGGDLLAYLADCARPRVTGLPDGAALCDLRVILAAGGDARTLAGDVSTVGSGFAWSPSPEARAIAALGEYDFARGEGTLRYAPVQDGKAGNPVVLGKEVTFYAFVPSSGALGFVSGGQLSILWPGSGKVEAIAGAGTVGTFEFNPSRRERPGSGPAAIWVVARRPLSAGGELVALADLARADRLGARAGDYRFSPGGAEIAFTTREEDGTSYDLYLAAAVPPQAAPVLLGKKVSSFAFSPHEPALAFLAGAVPGRPGELRASTEPGKSVKVAEKVGDYRWARDVLRLAWLQDYDPRIRSGSLAVGAPGQKPVVVGKRVTDYDLSPDGSAVAFVEHVMEGGYSVDLKLARPGSGAPAETLARGVFGFDFSPDGRALYYRTQCTGSQAEACDIYALPMTGSPATPVRIAEGAKSFEFAPGTPDRLLLTWTRRGTSSLDVGVYDRGRLIAVDKGVLPGSAQFLGPDAGWVAYIVADAKRAGVYVAQLPF